MKRNSGVTMISLVVTIIVLIILAGVSLNMTVGENGIITQAQKAKENMELAQTEEKQQLNQLYEELQNGGNGIFDDSSSDAVEKLENFKKVIAEAITQKGVATEPTDSAETMAGNIAKISSFQGGNITPIVSKGSGGTSCSITVPDGITQGYIVACANGFTLPTLTISGTGIDTQKEVGAFSAQQGSYKANHIVKIFYCTFVEGGTVTATMTVGGNNYASSLMLFQKPEDIEIVTSAGVGSTTCSLTVPEGTQEGYLITCANAFYLPDLYITGKGVEVQTEITSFSAQQGSMTANHIVKIYYCKFREGETISAKMYASGDNYATSMMIFH